jgi:3',5'-cyclic AMP phosphodiesterase CpdA
MPASRLLSAILVLAGVGLPFHCGPASAHDDAHGPHDHEPEAVAAAEAHRPSPLPDRIILSPAADPARGAAVSWRTSSAVRHGRAQITMATHGPELRLAPVTVPARTEPLDTDLGPAHGHSVEFGDLEPGTRYAYRVGDGVNWSEWFQFETAPREPTRFQFVHFGDAQNDILSLWSRVVREASRHAPRAQLMIHSGDLVNRGDSDAQWGEWFRAGGFLHASIPTLPIPGNHEYVKVGETGSRLTPHWRWQFTLPEHGPAGLEETCASIVYGATRIVVLNSNERLAEQAAWLDGLLTRDRRRWVVCSFHHPIYSAAKNRDNAALRAAWKPVLDRHAVDLVLQGHDHVYGRTGPVPAGDPPAAVPPPTLGNAATGVNRVEPTSGTVYVVSVSGPKQYDLSESHPLMERVGEDTQLFQVVEIEGDQLRFESRTAIGALYDGFVLEKRPGQPNRMVVTPAALPARRRPPKPAPAPEPAPSPSAAAAPAPTAVTPATTPPP